MLAPRVLARILVGLAPLALALLGEMTAASPPDAGQREAERDARPEDEAEEREEYLRRIHSYPYEAFPAAEMADAAEEYVRRRGEARRLYFRDPLDPEQLDRLLPASLPDGPWEETGPAPIHDRTGQTGVSYGNVAGRISAVAVHPALPDVILIGASRGGLWRSADRGASWTPVGDDLPTLVIADIEFAPSDPSIVYAATGDDDNNLWGAGVMKSTDGGLKWARIDDGSAASGIPNGIVLSKLVVDPADPDAVVVGSYSNWTATGGVIASTIFRSTDGGASWTRAVIPPPSADGMGSIKSLVIEPGCPANLWAVDNWNHTLIRSQDSGVSWSTVATIGLPAFTGNTKIAVHRPSCAEPATLYASVNSGAGLAGSSGYPGVYRSTDSGVHWSLPGPQPGPSGGCLSQCGRYDHELFVDPGDVDRVYMLGRDFWTSKDGGATWTNRSAGFDDANHYAGGRMHVDLHDAAIIGAGGSAVVEIAGDGGLWSYDVASDAFTNQNGNLAISEITDLSLHPSAPRRAIAGLQDNGSIQYLTSSVWNARVRGDGGNNGYLRTIAGAEHPFDGAFTSHVGNHGYVSTDFGATWSGFDQWASDASFAGEPAEFYAPWVATPGSNRVWHGAQSLWYCDFPGPCAPQWTKQADNLAALTGSSIVSKIAIHEPAIGVHGPFYVANAFGRGFLQSPDGVSWNNRSAGLPGRYISDIAFDPQAPQRVWVTVTSFGTGHVWYSVNGGAIWQDRSGNLPNVGVNDILIDPQDAASTWYVATDAGVYGTADAGASWSVVGINLPAVWATDLEISSDRMLYAATAGRSVWRIPLPGWVPPPPEVSAGPSLLMVEKAGAAVGATSIGGAKRSVKSRMMPGSSDAAASGSIGARLSWQDLGAAARGYNVYEGEIGGWYSHEPRACHLVAPELVCAAGRCATVLEPGGGNRYFLITATGDGGESPASSGASWIGPDHLAPPEYSVLAPCGS